MTSKNLAPIALLLLVGLSACAAGSEASRHAAESGALQQLVLGFWHGLIGPITVVGEIVNKLSPNTLPWTFRFYEAANTAVLYDIGFFVGVIAGPSFIWTGASRRRRTPL